MSVGSSTLRQAKNAPELFQMDEQDFRLKMSAIRLLQAYHKLLSMLSDQITCKHLQVCSQNPFKSNLLHYFCSFLDFKWPQPVSSVNNVSWATLKDSLLKKKSL